MTRPMKPKDHKEHLDRLSKLAAKVGLRDWEVTLDDVIHHGADFYASVDVAGEQKRAKIHLHKHYFKLDEREQRRVLLHELLHCLINPLVNQAELSVSHVLKTQARFVLKDSLEFHAEYIVDTLASEINEWMP